MSAGQIRAGGVFVEIGADPKKFFAALGKVNQQIGKLGSAISSAGVKMSALGAGIVTPVFAATVAFADAGSALFDMSKRTGVATEALSVLKFAADQTGTDMGGVEVALKKMQKTLFAAGNGSKEAAKALEMVGLSASDLAGLSADEQLGKIADGLMAIQDPGTRAAVAMQIFGKSGTDILPLLDGGSAGLKAFAEQARKLGLVMDKETAAKADELGDSIDALKAAMRVAFIQVGSAVAPMLTELAKGLALIAANAGAFIRDNQQLIVSLLKAGSAFVVIGGGLIALGKSLTVFSLAMGGIGKAATLAISPLTLLIGAASGVGKSFALAMPATIKLASTIGSSMLAASASVLSFAATASGAIAGFATSSATAVAGFAVSGAAGFMQMAGAASSAAQAMFPVFFTGFNRGIAAGAGFFSATLRGLNGVVMASSTLRGAMFAVSGSGMARFVTDIVGGLTLTYKSFVWWASGATARLAQYAVNLTGAVGKTIASTAAMSAAWLGSAARGVAAFVGSAVAGIGTYLAATVMAVAGSVASAAAVAAAWLAPLAPLLLLSAAAVGVGIAIKQFGPQISGAFSGVKGYIADAGNAIAGTFSSAVNDGMVVLGDLAKTANTTFNGVYEAVAAGDLSGAMDVLWAGLLAGWLRGTEALMSYVDPWVAAFQDVFTNVGAGIYIAWDKLYTDSASILNTLGAFVLGLFDNVANGVMATFDELVANIQIAWERVQGFITGAKDTEQRVQAIKDENAARAEQRMQERPGIGSRTAKAAKENAQAEKDRQDRATAVAAGAEQDKAARQEENKRRADARRAATQGAEDKLNNLVTSRREAEAAKQIAAATGEGAASPEQKAAAANATATAAESTTSKAEVAGTFSSVNLGGMGFGGSLAERQLKVLESIDKGIHEIGEEGAVAA